MKLCNREVNGVMGAHLVLSPDAGLAYRRLSGASGTLLSTPPLG